MMKDTSKNGLYWAPGGALTGGGNPPRAGPLVFSIESCHFVCLELVLKLHNPTFFRQLIVAELLYSTNVE